MSTNSTQTGSNLTYIYDSSQYTQLKYATIIATSMSVASTLIVISCFFYIWVHYPEKANRVSLRCVLIACFMKLFDGAIEIATVIETGDTSFCRVASILIMFGCAMYATFLAIVGINLVLVFVFHVKVNPRKLEWIYYPCGILYSLVTLIVPLIAVIHDTQAGKTDYLCYYYIYYYQVNENVSPSWMSWYAFVFFTTVIAVFCSAIASIKLLIENRNLLGKFKNIANSSESIEMSKTHVQYRKENQTNTFLKVVSRCILYTLVPFVCNICGFVLQLILLDPSPTAIPGFELALGDTIMRCLGGVFILIIFLSDPVMTCLIAKKYIAWKHKYLDEYSQIRKFPDGQIEMVQTQNSLLATTEERRKRSILSIHNNKAITNVSPTELVHMSSSNSNLDDTNGYFEDIENTISNQSIIMPMHRLMVSPGIFSRLTHSSLPNHLAATTAINGARTTPAWFIDPELGNSVLVPYKHPRMASAIHWLLVRFGFKLTKVEHSTNLPADVEGIFSKLSPPIPGRMRPVQQQLT